MLDTDDVQFNFCIQVEVSEECLCQSNNLACSSLGRIFISIANIIQEKVVISKCNADSEKAEASLDYVLCYNKVSMKF